MPDRRQTELVSVGYVAQFQWEHTENWIDCPHGERMATTPAEALEWITLCQKGAGKCRKRWKIQGNWTSLVKVRVVRRTITDLVVEEPG